MARLTKEIEIYEGRTVTVQELTVGEIRAWLARMEAGEETPDLVGDLLHENLALWELSTMVNLDPDALNQIALSALEQLVSTARALNPQFFRLRETLLNVGRAELQKQINALPGETPEKPEEPEEPGTH